ncbi:hypothetical protein [Vibrio metschnikovii]|uniref:hypothetical protein n=1 Tax=Vibrio metschnikovii TaxID=28172 RepID=UPI00130293B8|nr:hypothetical protein [Vibrio metschnikovii]
MKTFFVLVCLSIFCFYMAIKTSKKKNTTLLPPKKKISTSTPSARFTISMPTSVTYSDGKEEFEELSPIPFDDREILIINDERYYVAWAGLAPEATFSVNRKEKITIIPTHVLVKNMAIHVAEINEQNVKIIPTREISSQIQVKGYNRRSFWEWMRIINPEFPWNFHTAYPEHETCERDYSIVWKGTLAPTTFSRYEYHGYERKRKRETVKPIALYKGKLTGETKLEFIDSGNIKQIIKIDLIDTMLATEGHKKKHFDDWVNDVLLTSTAQ